MSILKAIRRTGVTGGWRQDISSGNVAGITGIGYREELWRSITLCEGKTRKKQPAVRHQTQPTFSVYTASYISSIHHPPLTKHLATSRTLYHSKNFLYKDQVKFNARRRVQTPGPNFCNTPLCLMNKQKTKRSSVTANFRQYISNVWTVILGSVFFTQ
jgi:hypothetical protein